MFYNPLPQITRVATAAVVLTLLPLGASAEVFLEPSRSFVNYQISAEQLPSEMAQFRSILKTSPTSKTCRQAVPFIAELPRGRVDEAHLLIGWCYERGRGVERDLAQALTWYTHAAEAGSPAGGYGTPPDSRAVPIFSAVQRASNATWPFPWLPTPGGTGRNARISPATSAWTVRGRPGDGEAESREE